MVPAQLSISSHNLNSRSAVMHVGIILPMMNLYCAAVITSTGSSFAAPAPGALQWHDHSLPATTFFFR